MTLGDALMNVTTKKEDNRRSQPGVFRVRNIFTNRSYYQATKDLRIAIRTMRNKLRTHNCGSPLLAGSWLLFGEDTHVFEVVREASTKEHADKAREEIMTDVYFDSPWLLLNVGFTATHRPSKKG